MPFPFKELFERLRKFYKDDTPAVTRIAARRKDPFLVLIGCLLSLRTKDETTDVAMERLMEKARTPEELLSIPRQELEDTIYPVGFYRVKARLIQEVSRTIIEKYGNAVPDSLDELLTIKGVGRKTANIVITEGFGIPGIAVDTHVHRICNRLGAVRTRKAEETERELRRILPEEYWIPLNPLLVTHGRRTCKPVSPFCSRCPVFDLCARAGLARSR